MDLDLSLIVLSLILMFLFWLVPGETALKTVRSMRRQLAETRWPDSKPPRTLRVRIWAVLPWLYLPVLSYLAIDTGRSAGSDEAIGLGLLVIVGFSSMWQLSWMVRGVISVVDAFRRAQDDAREIYRHIPEMEPTEALAALDSLLASIVGPTVGGESRAVN